MRVPLAVLLLVAACGDNGSDLPIDAGPPDADTSWARLGPRVELPLLANTNHASETSIAVHGDDVVVLAIGQQLPSADSFETPYLGRHDTAWTSHDRGATFGTPVDLVGGAFETSDPVVRVGADGRFWAAGIDVNTAVGTILSVSEDRGDTWAIVAMEPAGGDKEWLAIDDSDGSVYMCALDVVAHFDATGAPLGSITQGGEYPNCLSAYVGTGGVHYLTMDGVVHRWDGVAATPTTELESDLGAAPTLWSRSAGSIGPTDAGSWIVHGTRDGADATAVVLDVGPPLTRYPLTEAGTTAFLPAAARDEQGLLHVVWYETTGARGILRYTQSATSDLTGPFLAPATIDDNACPGDHWYPYGSTEDPPGGRRLREYIDIAVNAGRVHIAWTHAPDPPSRVVATYVDYD